jgi:hypothetical protein
MLRSMDLLVLLGILRQAAGSSWSVRSLAAALAVQPLHESVPRAVEHDPQLYELLALVDAMRVGDARVRGLAAALLHARLARVRV